MRTARVLSVYALFALVVLIGITITGCPDLPPDATDGGADDGQQDGTDDGGHPNDGGQDDGGGGTIISEQTRTLGDGVVIESLDANHARLTGDGLPEIHPGNVLVSAKDGGFLARVIAVTPVDGGLTVETEPAALTDVIRTGRLEIQEKLDTSTARLVRPLTAKPLATFKNENGVLKASELSFEMADKATVTVSDIVFDFSPDFDFVLDVEDWKINRFRCVASGQASVSFTAEVEVTAVTEFLEKKVELFSLEWPQPAGIAVIGGVPVVWQFFMEVNLGAGVYAENIGTLGADLNVSGGVSAGAEYNLTGEQRGWQSIGQTSFDAGADLADWSVTPVRAKVFVEPEFGLKFYKVIGPSISYEEYLELAGDIRFGQPGAELRNGREVNLNFTFEIVDPVKFQYSRNLYEGSEVLMARLAYGADPPELGTIGYSPLGALGFYWHTLTVNAWGEPTRGYELAGYSIRQLVSRGKRIVKAAELTDEPVDSSKLITAHFVPEGEGDDWTGSGVSATEGTKIVTTEVWPPGAGRIILFPALAKYRTGNNLIVQAVANDGFVFAHWDRQLTGVDEPVTTFSVPGNCTIRAVFGSEPPRTLRVPANYATIQDALDAATYNDIIELAAGTFTGPGNRDLDFEGRFAGTITIRGQGCGVTIIDLQGSQAAPHRLAEFGHTQGTIRLENLTLRNGYHTRGGAIHVVDSASAAGDGQTSLEVVDCCFENCAATYEGGAIFFGDPEEDQLFHVESTSFTGCGGDAAISIESTYAVVDARIASSTFTGNSGAIDVSSFQGSLAVTGCTFNANHTHSAVKLRTGTGIEVADCAFSNNQAAQNGSCVNSELSSVQVRNCTFFTNSVSGHNYAGAVWTRDNASLESCNFNGNSGYLAGAAFVDVGGVLRHCTFDGNTSTQDGGGLILGGSAFDCTFTNNTAGDEGGGVDLSGAAGILENCTVVGNTADLWGGGVNGTSGGVISACTIENNQCGGAGGLRIKNGVVRNCTITGNTATEYYGGGVLAEDSFIFACAIRNNQAPSGHGGGLDIRDTLLSGCVVEGNTASEEGGGLTSRNSTISDTPISGNSAAQGGGVHCYDDTAFYAVTTSGNTPDDCSGCAACP